jgi:hypothetical protein
MGFVDVIVADVGVIVVVGGISAVVSDSEKEKEEAGRSDKSNGTGGESSARFDDITGESESDRSCTMTLCTAERDVIDCNTVVVVVVVDDDQVRFGQSAKGGELCDGDESWESMTKATRTTTMMRK